MKEIVRPTGGAQKAMKLAMDRAAAEGRPVRVLFVCLGNICRSPAAEGVMRELTNCLPDSIRPELDSAGFYGGHAGELPDSRMRHAAFGRGLRLEHRSRKIRSLDFDYYDLLIGMDANNLSDLHDLAPTVEDESRIASMIDFAPHYPEYDSVPDPYWEGAAGFEIVLNLLEDACAGLYKEMGLDKES